jgi:precorrin-6Y C5,15-methyltransferase (decarboxylating)
VSNADSKIHIVGIGNDGLRGLTARERELLTAAEVVFGPEAILALVPELTAERHRIGIDLAGLVGELTGLVGRKRVVILVGGDPLFYGLARYLCEKLGNDTFEVLPHVSSMQLAFARVKESWEEAFLTNLQNHPLETVLDRIRVAEVVGLFPSEKEGPREIARALLARGLDYFRCYVCENLGGKDERITQGELADVQQLEFSPLNVVILKRKPGRPDVPPRQATFRRFGNPDDVFAQNRPKSGLITTGEVRALALARMNLEPGCVAWDIGAGSGSVSLEAARLCAPGMVYAIEQDAVDFHLIQANASTLGVTNLKAIHGVAPAVFATLPAPDAVFIGAVGREMQRLLEPAWQALRPGGNLVLNVGSLESLHGAFTLLKSLAGSVEVLLVNIARGVEQLETLRFESANPTFLLSASKPQRQ